MFRCVHQEYLGLIFSNLEENRPFSWNTLLPQIFCLSTFYYLRSMYVARKTPNRFPSFTKWAVFIKLILHAQARNSTQKRRLRQSSLCMTFYKSRPRKWNTKISKGALSSHAHTLADCKIFDRLDKSKEAEVHFLENVGFLIVRKYKSHKYLDIRILCIQKGCHKLAFATAFVMIIF